MASQLPFWGCMHVLGAPGARAVARCLEMRVVGWHHAQTAVRTCDPLTGHQQVFFTCSNLLQNWELRMGI